MTPTYDNPFVGAIVWAITAVGGAVTDVQDRTIIASYKGISYSLTYAPYPEAGQIGGCMDALRAIGAVSRVGEKVA